MLKKENIGVDHMINLDHVGVSINLFLPSSLEQSESRARPLEDPRINDVIGQNACCENVLQETGCVFVYLCPHFGCSGMKTSSVSSPACQMCSFSARVPFETSCRRSFSKVTQEGLSLCSACHLATPGEPGVSG